MIRPDAWKIIEERSLANRNADADMDEQTQLKRTEKLHYLLKKLLTGAQLSGEEGRELFYEWIADLPMLKVNPFTGNSQTYFILGCQQRPKQLLQLIEEEFFEEFVKMKREAVARKKKARGEN